MSCRVVSCERAGKRKAEGEEQEETPRETAPTYQAATSQEETTDEASGGGDEEDKEARRKEEAAREEKRARARRWCAELEREVEGSGGAVVNSCGHLMHPECRHQYSLSVARDSARGRLTVDPMLTPSALAQVRINLPPLPPRARADTRHTHDIRHTHTHTTAHGEGRFPVSAVPIAGQRAAPAPHFRRQFPPRRHGGG
jgi:hypothetical protein